MESQNSPSDSITPSNQTDVDDGDRLKRIEKPIAVSIWIALAVYILSWGGVYLVQEMIIGLDLDLLGFVFYFSSVLPIVPLLIVLLGGVWSLTRKLISIR